MQAGRMPIRGVFEISAPLRHWAPRGKPRARGKEHLTLENAILRRRSTCVITRPRPKRDLGCRPQVATQQSLARHALTRTRLRHHARCGTGVARALLKD